MDAGALRGYRVERNDRLYSLVRRPTRSIPARATWSIQAVGRVGNRGVPARIVVR